MEAPHEAQVIPIHNGVERIAGIKMHLGRMTLPVLQQLEGYARERVTEAQDDLWIIQHYVELAAPGPEAA